MDILGLLGVKGIVIGTAAVVAISSGGYAIHLYNKSIRDAALAAQEKKTADLRKKGEEIIQKATIRGKEYASELVKQQAGELDKAKADLRKSEAARHTDSITFAETNAVFNNWRNDSVPPYVVERMRLRIQALQERTDSVTAAILSSDLPEESKGISK